MYPRPITDIEKYHLRRIIKDYTISKDERDRFLSQLDDLVVVSKCDCGDPDCCTVQFQHYIKGNSVGLHQMFLGGRIAILHINSGTSEIAELELI